MRTAIQASVFVLGCLVRSASAQAAPDPDSLVASFVERGGAGYTPALFLKGCPAIEPWQEQGLERILDLELPAERVAELAISMGVVLHCNDPRVDNWFVRAMDAAVSDQHHAALFALLTSLQGHRSPVIREFARSKMFDERLSSDLREKFGMLLFETVEFPAEALEELTQAMAARSLPYGVAISAVFRLLRADAPGTIDRVLTLAENDSGVVTQAAFDQLAISAAQYADAATMASMEDRLARLAERRSLTPLQKSRIDGALWSVRRGTKN